jgi:hypothetical protein
MDYEFVNTGKEVLEGERVLKFIGEPYLSEDELTEWTSKLPRDSGKTGQGVCFVKVL